MHHMVIIAVSFREMLFSRQQWRPEEAHLPSLRGWEAFHRNLQVSYARIPGEYSDRTVESSTLSPSSRRSAFSVLWWFLKNGV
jgi:hypothetical protein